MRAPEMHPQARAVVERQRRLGLVPLPKVDPRVIRLLTRAVDRIRNRNPPAVGATYDRTIPGPDGGLPVRVYRPDADGPYPTIVFFHGGGWVFGSLESHDTLCRRLARATGAVVVAVDYRLAPEHRFPAALEDAYAATGWVDDNPDALAADGRLAVAGDSAGGALAAGVSLLARDRGGPEVDRQIVLYPGIGVREGQESLEENDGIVLAAADLEWFHDRYYGSDLHRRNPYADPTAACDLSGVAPATVVTAGFDPLRDGGVAYAERLADDGVAVSHRHYGDMIHGFATAPGIDRAEAVVADVAADLRDAPGF